MINRILCVSLFFGLLSCGTIKDAIDSLLTFSIEEDIPEQTIQGSSLPCSIPETLSLNFFQMPPIKITKENNFPDQGTRADLITKAVLTQFILTKTASSQEANFNWLESLKIFIEAANNDKKLIAQIATIPEDSTSISLTPANEDLSQYIKANDGFTVSTEATGCPPKSDFSFEGRLTMEVSASPL